MKIEKEIVDWYLSVKRDLPFRKTRDPYCIWVSEIMLQQTRIEAVKKYYARFMEELPTVHDLANISEERFSDISKGDFAKRFVPTSLIVLSLESINTDSCTFPLIMKSS